jgi:hypothetical protein
MVNGYLQEETVEKQGKNCQNKIKDMLGMVVNAYNPSDWEAKTERS